MQPVLYLKLVATYLEKGNLCWGVCVGVERELEEFLLEGHATLPTVCLQREIPSG